MMISGTEVILFSFAGRRANLELQLPLLHRLTEDHPGVRVDLWNLARDPIDSLYLRDLRDDAVRVMNNFRWPWIARVWRHYAIPRYRKTVFVKIDDDVVFFQTERFAELVEAVKAHPDTIVSADVINNGACTRLHPPLWDEFAALNIDLLDVHMSADYARAAHEYLFEHWAELIAHPVELVETQDWLSINLIGMDWPTLCRLTNSLGKRSLRWIAGREWHAQSRLGDEGAANLLPRMILRGLLAAHLGFGPQELTEEQLIPWRENYAKINRQYLDGAVNSD